MQYLLTKEELDDLVPRAAMTAAFQNLKTAELTIAELHKQINQLRQENKELKKRPTAVGMEKNDVAG